MREAYRLAKANVAPLFIPPLRIAIISGILIGVLNKSISVTTSRDSLQSPTVWT